MPSKYKVSYQENIFSFTKPIKLKFYVSVDSEKQSHEQLRAYVDFINKHRDQIEELEVIDTTYLHRHYGPEKNIKDLNTKWCKANKKILETLIVKYKISAYYDILQTDTYKNLYPQISKGYEEDSTFKKIVDDLAQVFSKKGRNRTLDAAKLYILDESAAYMANGNGYSTYPGEYHAALSYLLKLEKYQSYSQNKTWLPYDIKGSGSNSPTKHSDDEGKPSTSPPSSFKQLSFFGQYVGSLADELDLKTQAEQTEFLYKFRFFADGLVQSKKQKFNSEDNVIDITHAQESSRSAIKINS